MRTLLKAGTLVTVDPTIGEIERGEVLIEDATILTRYIAAMSKQRVPYEYVSLHEPLAEHMRAGRVLMSKDYFDCFSCHQQGDKKPEGPPEGWAPGLSLATRRFVRSNRFISWSATEKE